jgi:hypothetical protein
LLQLLFWPARLHLRRLLFALALTTRVIAGTAITTVIAASRNG